MTHNHGINVYVWNEITIHFKCLIYEITISFKRQTSNISESY